MKSLRMAVRKHWLSVAVIGFLVVLAGAVGAYVLQQQRLPLPWTDVYHVKASFASAQAVTPGQGEAVTVAGVDVGEISSVAVEDGRAIVTMRIKRHELPEVYGDATAALRPRTGLQDMTIELDPGTKSSRALPDGGTLRRSKTVSEVELDEVLASLDSDTRVYFQQLLEASAKGFTGNAGAFHKLLRVGTPTVREAHEVLDVIDQRRTAVKQVVTRLGDLSQALGEHDRAVGETLDRAAVTLRTLAGRDRELRQSLGLLPGTLRLTSTTLDDAARFADELGPTSRALRPAIRDVTAALPRIDPLLRELPADLVPVRTLAVQGREPIRTLRTTVQTLQPLLPDLDDTAKVLQHVVNVLGYDPPGTGKGFSYYLAWFAHNANSVFSTQDAHGVSWRGQLILSCSSLSGLAPLRPITDLLGGLGICQ